MKFEWDTEYSQKVHRFAANICSVYLIGFGSYEDAMQYHFKGIDKGFAKDVLCAVLAHAEGCPTLTTSTIICHAAEKMKL